MINLENGPIFEILQFVKLTIGFSKLSKFQKLTNFEIVRSFIFAIYKLISMLYISNFISYCSDAPSWTVLHLNV